LSEFLAGFIGALNTSISMRLGRDFEPLEDDF